MNRAMRIASLMAALVMAVVGCAPAPKPEPAPEAPADFPAAVYRAAHAAGASVYCLDPGRSSLVVRVYRAGPLARLGHDHVVSTRAIHGYVWQATDPARSRADVYVPVGALEVDDPQLRAEAGLHATLSEADIAATRRNMMGKVLEAERYPYVQVRATWDPGAGAESRRLAVALTLHGVTRHRAVPVRLALDEGLLRMEGALRIAQSDFGITPFSALGGALRVADRVDMQFRLRARSLSARGGCRVPPPREPSPRE